MTESLAEVRAEVAEIARRVNGTVPPMRWRVIETDSESTDGVALICPTEHPVFGGEVGPTSDVTGFYDCCPWPRFEAGSESMAAYLVALLNADTERVTAPAPLCDCGAEIPVPQRKAYCSDRCHWADQDHGSDDVGGGDDQ